MKIISKCYHLENVKTGGTQEIFDTWFDAQMAVGEIIDDKYGHEHLQIATWIEDNDRIWHKVSTLTLEEFLEVPQDEITHIDNINFDVVLEDKPDSTHVLDKEPFHHLNEDETKEVLMYTQTGFIVGELVRRLEEYDKTISGITKLLDDMKIYI